MSDVCLIIGAGQAGLIVAQSLREKGYAGGITILGDELHPPYQRPPLSKKFLSGDITEDRLHLKPAAFYAAQSIDLRLGVHVTGIDPAHRRVEHDGGVFAYDTLVIATGTRPRSLPLPGADLPGVHMLRGIPDVDRIRAALAKRGKLVIVGGGYIGLEVAAVAREMGLAVTVVEAQDRVMARAVAEPVSRYYEDLHRRNGIEILLGTALARIERHGERLMAITRDGVPHQADLVLVAIGAVPNTELASGAGLAVDGGIVVDQHGRTSDPAIFAAGDVTAFPSALYGRNVRLESVQNAIDQAKHVAAAIAGDLTPYDPVPWFWSDQFGIKLQIAGLSQGATDIVIRPGDNGTFSVFYLDRGRLLAVDSIDRARDHMHARRAIGRRLTGGTDALRDPAADWTTLFNAA
jgi:3-phenylpropionate/trans-cinnamate dioxygenase ferredoxin reductase subunit